MRELVNKYAGECRKCANPLPVGSTVIYEKRVGIYCPPCAPTEVEEIREVRQEAADRRADKLEEWADKREAKANALIARNEPYRGDIAFNTQPGHIPERARVIARGEKAFEHQDMANSLQARANSIRSGVRVAGDAEARRQAARDRIKPLLKVGMKVDTGIYGHGIISRINKKTATVSNCGTSHTYTTTVDLSWLHPLEVMA